MDTRRKERNFSKLLSERKTSLSPDERNPVQSSGYRPRSRTWSSGAASKYKKGRGQKTASDESLGEAASLLTESFHGGQLIQLSVTEAKDETEPSRSRESRPKITRSRLSSPRHSIQNNHLLTPRPSIQNGKSGFRQRKDSRISVLSYDDGSSVSSTFLPPHPPPPRSAWEVFSDHIRELDSGCIQFNPNQEIFRRSDTFDQCCSTLDYMDVVNRESIDIESVYDLDLPFSTEPRLSVFSVGRSTGRGRLDSVNQLLVPGSVHGGSRCQSPENALLCDEETGEMMARGGMEKGTGREGQAAGVRGLKPGGPELHAVSDLLQEEDPKARKELYQRYLYQPDTWTLGLQKYLKKSILREKTNKFSTGSNWYPQPVYRPKSALVAANKKPKSAPKRRVLSAVYPSSASVRKNVRIPSAMSTMSRFREPPSLA